MSKQPLVAPVHFLTKPDHHGVDDGAYGGADVGGDGGADDGPNVCLLVGWEGRGSDSFFVVAAKRCKNVPEILATTVCWPHAQKMFSLI